MQEADRALGAEGEDGDEFGGVLKKQKGRAAIEDVGTAGDAQEGEEKTQELLDAYFGNDNQLADDERFLKHYMLNKVTIYQIRGHHDPWLYEWTQLH